MKRIAIFASGGGSNARKILEYFREVPDIEVTLVVSNKNNAGVLKHAADFDVPTYILSRPDFYERTVVVDHLQSLSIDLIVLAGFLWLVPSSMVEAYPDAIVNIHPALLPKFGGKGMYGKHVHAAVVESQESETGITIHYVNEQYDDGEHLYQASCPVLPTDTPEDVAARVLYLEHEHYAVVIDRILRGTL